jgi:hypothetical protein
MQEIEVVVLIDKKIKLIKIKCSVKKNLKTDTHKVWLKSKEIKSDIERASEKDIYIYIYIYLERERERERERESERE